MTKSRLLGAIRAFNWSCLTVTSWRMPTKLIGVCGRLAILGVMGSVNAATVSVTWTGKIGPTNAEPFGVEAGDPFSITITYDDSVVGTPSYFYTGYQFDGGINQVSFSAGTFSANSSYVADSSTDFHMNVANNTSGLDQIFFSIDTSIPAGTASLTRLGVNLKNNTQTALSDESLVDLSLLDLADFSVRDVGFTITEAPLARSGQGELAVVPIPAGLWLFGSGLLGLIGVSRRKYEG